MRSHSTDGQQNTKYVSATSCWSNFENLLAAPLLSHIAFIFLVVFIALWFYGFIGPWMKGCFFYPFYTSSYYWFCMSLGNLACWKNKSQTAIACSIETGAQKLLLQLLKLSYGKFTTFQVTISAMIYIFLDWHFGWHPFN